MYILKTLGSHFCTFLYIGITFWHIWKFTKNIFKHFYFGTQKKHFFPRSKKNVVKCVCMKNTFWNILSHLIFLAHFNNILLASICLVSASIVFFQKMFSYVHFSKNVIPMYKNVQKCYPNVFKCTFLHILCTFYTSATINLQQKQQKNSNINNKNVHKLT